jgi:hypothetical protein
MSWSIVSGCEAYTNSGSTSKGGGIYAVGSAHVVNSLVAGNTAYNVTNDARGGGVYVKLGSVSLNRSTISGNAAIARGASPGVGGGIFGPDPSISSSTIESNFAGDAGGIYGGNGGSSVQIQNSTVSGNVASRNAGGIKAYVQFLSIDNSTVAFNTAANFAGVLGASRLSALSSIIARNINTSPGSFSDVYLKSAAPTIAGADNLIVSCNTVPESGVITVTADPQLTPLAFHGGYTRTHALLATSPAVDHGNNVLNLPGDQRDAPRVVGAGADIGAYERQVDDDEIFYGAFQ